MGKGMKWETLVKILLALALGVAGVASPRLAGAYAMQVTTTTVADTVYHADGTAATGTVILNWPTFTTMSGEVIQGGSQSTTIGAGGALSVALVPNVGATPIGTYYTAVYHLDDGSVQKEYWVIPVSTGSVTIAAVKNTVLPTSVAMQTVSKSYVDTAIAAAVTGHPLDSSPYVVKAGVFAGCHTLAATSTGHLYKDGVETTYGAFAAPPSTAVTGSTSYQLGTGNGNASLWNYGGQIMYAQIYKTAVLTAAQILAETQYMNGRSGADPYTALSGTSRANTITFGDDSITVGVGGSGTTYLNSTNFALNNTYAINTYAAGGEEACAVFANFQFRNAGVGAPNAGKNIYSIFAGTNDIAVDGRTGADTFACLRAYVAKAYANGASRVIVTTMLDRGGTATTYRAAKNAYNTLIRQNAVALNYQLNDAAQDARLGADGGSNNALTNCPGSVPCINSDSTHPTAAGYGLLATAFSTVINSMDGSNASSPDVTASNAFTGTAANNYVVQTPTAAATHAMTACTYLTGPQYARTIVNGSSTYSITVSSASTITGNTTIAPGDVAVFTPELVGATTGGCYWLRTR